MYELKLPQPLTTVRVEWDDHGAWVPAILQTLKENNYEIHIDPSVRHSDYSVILVDSVLCCASAKGVDPRTLHWQDLPTIRQVLKVNNNAVLYDRLSEHADGSLGNANLSSMHLMD
jgi:hypothetical protein